MQSCVFCDSRTVLRVPIRREHEATIHYAICSDCWRECCKYALKQFEWYANHKYDKYED